MFLKPMERGITNRFTKWGGSLIKVTFIERAQARQNFGRQNSFSGWGFRAGIILIIRI